MNTLSHFILRLDKSYNSNAYKSKQTQQAQDGLLVEKALCLINVMDILR